MNEYGSGRSGRAFGNTPLSSSVRAQMGKIAYRQSLAFGERNQLSQAILGCVTAQAFFRHGASAISLKARVFQRNLA